MQPRIRLSASTRFVLAFLRLSADIAEGFGRAILNILQKQYPGMLREMREGRYMAPDGKGGLQQREDDRYKENPAASIGHKLLAIARKQLQYNDQDAYDAIQDFLVYLTSSKFDFKAQTKSGKPGAATWHQALDNIFSNMRTRAMSHSFKKFKAGKYTEEDLYADLMWRKQQIAQGNKRYTWTDEDNKELERLVQALRARKVDLSKIVPTKLRRKNIRDKTLDEAFGKRDEEGGAPSGGLERMQTAPDSSMAMPLDERAAKKSFMEVLDQVVPDLQNELNQPEYRTVDRTPDFPTGLPAQRFLFEFIFSEEGTGSFLPDIKANMGQATDFRDWLEERATKPGPNGKEAREILKRYAKRWSGFVGDTRLKLMKSIQSFMEEALPEEEYEQLWDEFFSDTTPREVEKLKERRDLEAVRYQRGRDLRSLIRMMEEDRLGMLSTKQKSEMTKLKQKISREIEDEVADRLADAQAKHKKALEKYGRALDVYMRKREQVADLPVEKQPKLDRPVKPKPVDPAAIAREVGTLDAQLKFELARSGEEIRKAVEDEFKHQVQKEEETQKARDIAEQAISEVNERHAPSAPAAPSGVDEAKVKERYEDIMNSARKFGGERFLSHLKGDLREAAVKPDMFDEYAGWSRQEIEALWSLLYREPMGTIDVSARIALRLIQA